MKGEFSRIAQSRLWRVLFGFMLVPAAGALVLGLTPESHAETYIVRPGDTLWDIARAHGCQVATLKSSNQLRDDTIRPGQKLRVEECSDQPASAPASASELLARCPVADGFDYPVGDGQARGYYNAQPFGENHHLGDDWNGVGGGDTDLGDPVIAIASGVVVAARDEGGGWGNVVRIVHNAGTAKRARHVESLYAHLDRIEVEVGQVIERGQRVGTIGDAHGEYLAHLHFEIRDRVGLALGPGYASDIAGYLDPTWFIESRRAEITEDR